MIAPPVPALSLPDAEPLVLAPEGGVLLTDDGELLTLDSAALRRRIDGPPLLLCHARAVSRRCGLEVMGAFDLLELFAFARPGLFSAPTPRGLASALGLPVPASLEDAAITLPRLAETLLRGLSIPAADERSDPAALATRMGEAGWPWAPFVLRALGLRAPVEDHRKRGAYQVWAHLPEWEAEPPNPPPSQHPVEPREARARLALMLGEGAEPRPQQGDYAGAVAAAFAPRPAPDDPTVVLAQAGTGTGKTLGYLAPATVWAQKNGAPVWVSTYTRNLQHQIDGEMDRLFPDPVLKARQVVLRKGRENYLCLLNYEDAVRGLALNPRDAVPLGLMARWAAATRDGDLTGGDFPGWLADIIGRPNSLALADRRGECIHSGCPHYSRCFIERGIRRARKAQIVIANHALVMIQAAQGGVDDRDAPSRFVFDEGHHLFEAADSAFGGHLTGLEATDLRRWLLGHEEGGRRASRGRGLKRRVEDLLPGEEALATVDDIERAARALPGPGWGKRIHADDPRGPAERFLALTRAQVYARAQGADGPYSLECDTTDPVEGLVDAALALDVALAELQAPLQALAKSFRERLDEEAASLDPNQRQRLDAAARSLDRRARMEIGGWRAMLTSLSEPTPPWLVDWFGIERVEGRELDFGFYRHYVDPTRPFIDSLLRQAHGIVVTSATLTDGAGDNPDDWRAAEDRTGAGHLPRPAIRAQVASPFDYPALTRVLIVRDVRKDDLEQVGAAYRELFLAAGGGALGLFTAVSRLRAVHHALAPALQAAGLPLYAQHLDGMDVGTLIDIFRGEPDACLLGTDAVRDGVDVPGRALRLMVFDRVPWPRPDILSRARGLHFGKQRWSDMQTRFRLKQAFGRLVRRADDRGVFVLLDPMMPTRLCTAFPPGVEVQRIGLAEAVAITREFLALEPAAALPHLDSLDRRDT